MGGIIKYVKILKIYKDQSGPPYQIDTKPIDIIHIIIEWVSTKTISQVEFVELNDLTISMLKSSYEVVNKDYDNLVKWFEHTKID